MSPLVAEGFAPPDVVASVIAMLASDDGRFVTGTAAPHRRRRPRLTTPPAPMGNAAAGRVALVTGASQGGTGTVAAVRLAAEGAAVAITARSVDGLERTREEIETLGGTVLVVPCDLADRDGGRDALVARTEAELGPIDILVNNAAAGGYRPLEAWTQDDLDRVMELNLYAPWLLMRQVLPGMRERGRGWIVNLTSFARRAPARAALPRPTGPAKTGSAYGASKAALNRLTVAAAAETEGQGIAVNALTPQAADRGAVTGRRRAGSTRPTSSRSTRWRRRCSRSATCDPGRVCTGASPTASSSCTSWASRCSTPTASTRSTAGSRPTSRRASPVRPPG